MALKQIKTEGFEMKQEIDPKIEEKVMKKRRKKMKIQERDRGKVN